MPKKVLKEKLTINQKSFCEIFFAQGCYRQGAAYAQAYYFDYSIESERKTCDSCASELLRNPKIIEYLDFLNKGAKVTKKHIDKNLFFLMHQRKDYKAAATAVQIAVNRDLKLEEMKNEKQAQEKGIFKPNNVIIQVVKNDTKDNESLGEIE